MIAAAPRCRAKRRTLSSFLDNDLVFRAAFAKEPGERFGDEREPVGRTPVGVAAWMQHDAEQPQRFSAVQLIGHRVDGLPAESRIRRGEVDEVAGVRHDGSQTRRLDLGAEFRDFFGRQRPSPPLVGVFREDLERLAAVDHRPIHRARQSAGDRL